MFFLQDDVLLQQPQYAAAVLVCLRQHALRRLQQHIRLRVVGECLRHVGVADRAFGCRDVFVGDGQVFRREVDTALHRIIYYLVSTSLIEPTPGIFLPLLRNFFQRGVAPAGAYKKAQGRIVPLCLHNIFSAHEKERAQTVSITNVNSCLSA